MIKDCRYCDNYGEVDDSKCGCGINRKICPVCKGLSNPALMYQMLNDKIDRLASVVSSLSLRVNVS